MLSQKYEGAKYEPDNFKSNFDNLCIDSSYYLSNQRDQQNYAFISWRMRDGNDSQKYVEQGEGYFVSSIILLEQCLLENRDRKGDGVIFPILFNIEQGIELYLKGFIYLIRENGASVNFKINVHNIKQLLFNFTDTISSWSSNYADIACCNFDYVNRLIDLLFEKTTDCTYARFPFDNSGNGHFYVNSSENIIIDMKILLEWTKAVLYILNRNFNRLRMCTDKGNDTFTL